MDSKNRSKFATKGSALGRGGEGEGDVEADEEEEDTEGFEESSDSALFSNTCVSMVGTAEIGSLTDLGFGLTGFRSVS